MARSGRAAFAVRGVELPRVECTPVQEWTRPIVGARLWDSAVRYDGDNLIQPGGCSGHLAAAADAASLVPPRADGAARAGDARQQRGRPADAARLLHRAGAVAGAVRRPAGPLCR